MAWLAVFSILLYRDIAFAVSDLELSSFVSNPGKPHLEAAKCMFLYLKKTFESLACQATTRRPPGVAQGWQSR